VGRVVARLKEGQWTCAFDEDRAGGGDGRRRLTDAQVLRGCRACAPALAYPELERDPLYDQQIMVWWPMDSIYYAGTVVGCRHGAPPCRPPGDRDASPAAEHLVMYEDGSSEWLDFRKEKIRLPEATRAAGRAGRDVQELVAEDDQQWFNQPVDAEAMGLTNYHDVIRAPMDLGTVDDRLSRGYYDDVAVPGEKERGAAWEVLGALPVIALSLRLVQVPAKSVDARCLGPRRCRTPREEDARNAARIRAGAAADVRLAFRNAIQ